MIRIIFIFFIFVSLAHADITIRKQNDLYCFDGDTCYATVGGIDEKVRLLELDTPEISKPKHSLLARFTRGVSILYKSPQPGVL